MLRTPFFVSRTPHSYEWHCGKSTAYLPHDAAAKNIIEQQLKQILITKFALYCHIVVVMLHYCTFCYCFWFFCYCCLASCHNKCNWNACNAWTVQHLLHATLLPVALILLPNCCCCFCCRNCQTKCSCFKLHLLRKRLQLDDLQMPTRQLYAQTVTYCLCWVFMCMCECMRI